MNTPLKKILIIDDELSILNGIYDKFTHEGFSVIKAIDGADGLNKALKDHPDFILVDNLMPEADGFYFLENLRKDDWGKNARVIMWSNSHDANTIKKAKELGVVDFMIKSEWEYRDIVKKATESIAK